MRKSNCPASTIVAQMDFPGIIHLVPDALLTFSMRSFHALVLDPLLLRSLRRLEESLRLRRSDAPSLVWMSLCTVDHLLIMVFSFLPAPRILASFSRCFFVDVDCFFELEPFRSFVVAAGVVDDRLDGSLVIVLEVAFFVTLAETELLPTALLLFRLTAGNIFGTTSKTDGTHNGRRKAEAISAIGTS